MSSIAYAVMAFVGFEICWWWHKNIQTLLNPIPRDLRETLLIIFSGITFLLLLQRAFESYVPSYRRFKSTLASYMGQFGWLGSLWLALISAVGEELLFRGAIQPFLGVWFTSILFGFLHLDPEEGVSAWTLWAMIAGLILGASCSVTGSLWPPIAIHFVVNFLGIRSLSKLNLKSTKQKSSGTA